MDTRAHLITHQWPCECHFDSKPRKGSDGGNPGGQRGTETVLADVTTSQGQQRSLPGVELSWLL